MFGLEAVSEGDNTIQRLFHQQNGREGAGMGREGLGGSCRYEAAKALVCGPVSVMVWRLWRWWDTAGFIIINLVLTCLHLWNEEEKWYIYTINSAKEPFST